MPELPEVETVRRVMERVLSGKTIASVELPEDPILLEKRPAQPFREALSGAFVEKIGRRGKYWWLELRDRPTIFGHLGMTGWIRELGADTIRLKEHGSAPLDDESGRPRFLRLMLEAEDGRKIAFTDGRRLGRMWMADSPDADPRVAKLGPDVWTEMPSVADLAQKVLRKRAPIKAILLDQAIFAGVGNWIADEALYQARIAPQRLGASLSMDELARLREVLWKIVDHAVEVGADEKHYPEDWLFHVRWGGAKGADVILGRTIVRETIGGRTTAWVPDLQS